MPSKYYANTYTGIEGGTGFALSVDEEFDDIETGMATGEAEANSALQVTNVNGNVIPGTELQRTNGYLYFSAGGSPFRPTMTPTLYGTYNEESLIGTLGLRLASDSVNFTTTTDLVWSRVGSHKTPFYVFPETTEPNEAITCAAGLYVFLLAGRCEAVTTPLNANLQMWRDTGGGMTLFESYRLDTSAGAGVYQDFAVFFTSDQSSNFDVKIRLSYDVDSEVNLLNTGLTCWRIDA